MLLTSVVTAVVDRYTTETIAAAKLDRLVDAAVRWYSRFNPYSKSTTIPTVDDQQIYDMPADCMVGTEVDYWPSGGLERALNAARDDAENLRRPTRYDLISERVIEDIKEQQHIERVRGAWEMNSNNQLLLWPVPGTSSVDVIVTYGAVHVLSGTLTTRAYATIPAADLEIIRDLTVSEIIEAKMAEYSVETDYAEGLSRQTKHFIPGNIAATIAYLRGKCTAKYGRVVVAL